MSQIFRVKPIEAILKDAQGEEGGKALQRVLGLPSLLALGVGTIMGAGVFVLTGTAAAQYAGPSLILSFIIAAIACAFSAICYSEFAAMIPVAGSAYTYGYATLGEVVAFVIGLASVLEFLLGASAISVGWTGYTYSLLQDFFGSISPRFIDIPGVDYVLWNNRWCTLASAQNDLTSANIDISQLQHCTSCGNFVGFTLVAIVTLLLIRGVKLSTRINNLLVAIKLGLVLLFVSVVGYYLINHPQVALNNWTPFIPENTGEYGKFGWSGIISGAAILFFAYAGFDCVSTAAQEAKNPSRDLPLATVGSLLVCTICYILVCALITGTINYTELNVPDPAARAIHVTGVSWGIIMLKVGLSIALISGVLSLIMGNSRILYGMASDGLFPASLNKIHSSYNTPWVSLLVSAIPVSILTTFFPLHELSELVAIGSLMAFSIVCLGVLVLRKKYPNQQRTFSTPGVPFVPILGAVISMVMMFSLSGLTWLRFIVFLATGMAFYFLYSVKHSKLAQKDN